MKSLFKQVNILNLLLVTAVFFSLTHEFRLDAPARRQAAITEHARAGLKNGNTAKSILNGIGIAKAAGNTGDADPLSSYAIIAGQNLFNPGRTIPVDKPAAAIYQPPPKPVLVLHGTLITDYFKVAYIEVQKTGQAPFQPQRTGYPYRTNFYPPQHVPQSPSGAAKTGTYREGDSIDGFVITGIGPDKVELARGKETMEVYLSTPLKDMTGINQAPVRPAYMPMPAGRPPFR
ncbi:MAG: hypothetical protein M0018_01720 [Nitrospiraceae bacterium]|nr:hypothetical protein [Nitrospiraceae bacterium]